MCCFQNQLYYSSGLGATLRMSHLSWHLWLSAAGKSISWDFIFFTCKNKSEPLVTLYERHLVPWTFLPLPSRFHSSSCAGSVAPPSCVCVSCPSPSFVWVTSCGSRWLRILWQPWPPFSRNPTCLLWTAASQLFCKLSGLVRRTTAMLFIMIWN